MATVISSPTIGSANGNPSMTPIGTEHDGQGGEPVGACVQPVGDQGRGPDPGADPDPVDRDQLVAGEPDQPGRRRSMAG